MTLLSIEHEINEQSSHSEGAFASILENGKDLHVLDTKL